MTQKRKTEDYVKTVYALQKKGDVRGSYIAKALNVSRPTVSVALRALEQEGFLRICRNRTVVLTEKGTKMAEEVISRNASFYNLLISLGVSEDTAAKDACNLEHVLSQKSLTALMSLAKN